MIWYSPSGTKGLGETPSDLQKKQPTELKGQLSFHFDIFGLKILGSKIWVQNVELKNQCQNFESIILNQTVQVKFFAKLSEDLKVLVTYQTTHGQKGIGARDAIAPKNLHKVTILLSNKLSNSVQLLCAKMTSHF